MLTIYKGFDYNYNGDIFDVEYHSELYHSIMKLKKCCSTWIDAEKKANENPKEYHVTPISIASDYYGEPFEHGDCFKGKFNVRIIGIKII